MFSFPGKNVNQIDVHFIENYIDYKKKQKMVLIQNERPESQRGNRKEMIKQ